MRTAKKRLKQQFYKTKDMEGAELVNQPCNAELGSVLLAPQAAQLMVYFYLSVKTTR